uniref:A disintegrin and metalloproteinase with thrombospondin motifs 20-like n=1 Tax=Saccoglossus kowalevskii TaxID=10224 RepID=A0ABM0MU47_SACKO|nr:PREDICTED: A disintegrin and metalloproteinase with thrombospondin motifs 20-like [Saccoglossus kowalevskii]
MAFTGFYFIFIAALLPRVFLALPLNSLNTDLYGVGIDGIPQQYAATVDQNDAITDHAIVHPWYLDRQPPDGGDANKAVEYMFSAFDEEFHLILEPAYDFFTDSLVIQYSWANTSLLLPPTQYCYYQGVSNNHNGSKAYANTCAGGLSALVLTEDAHYFVQPIDDENSLKYEADDENSLKYEADDENSLKYEADDGEPPAHVMHKRSASQLVCGVEDETTGHHSRGKRYANTVTQKTKHLEVVIVADEILRRQHGADTEYYILSTFNQVYALFKDSTLGVDLKLNVKRIRILEEAQEDLHLENVQTSLQRFCAWEWQRRLDTDISILITGRNMGFGNQYDVTGNAMGIGSACNPDKRCVIAEDHGPSGLVFTLAHEIAHTLGIYHDGELSRCANDGYIMSPTNSGGKRAFQWSRCSRNDIFNWLESPGASCLDNVPPSTPGYFLSRVPLPGHYYDADYQCSAIWHDAGATVAEPVKNSKDICEELYCDYATFNMVSNHIPPLDGTSCGIHRACIRGWCMNLYSTRDCGEQACPATFYESEWETCNPNAEQNPCIQSRLVQCGELHNDGSFVALEISDCIAGGEELPVSQRCCCTTGSCTVASPTTERYQWLASDFSSSCTPNCGVNSVHTRIVSCYDSVLNVPTDVEVLCDSSSKPSDTTPCTTCYLWEASAFGSCSATCGTNVIQTRTVTCKDGISGQVLSDSLCDAASKPSDVQLCTNLPACPTTSRYAWIIGGFGECSVSCGGGSRSRSVACFDNQVQGVVLDDLCITNVGVKPQTEFEACNQQSCEIQAYQYEYGTWGICSQTCGTGIQARSITCKRIADSVVVPESNCVDQGLIRDSATQTCNMGDCPGTTFYEYYTTQWGTCSLTCGGGTQSRTIYCAVAGTNGQSSAAESNCLQQGLVKPSDAQFCNTQSCTTSTYEYRSLNWQPCTVTCGGGTQTRFAYCAFVGTTNGVPESFCEDQGLTKPSETQSCNTEACSTNTYEYFTTSFGSCTVSCGGGTQSRTVYCAVAGTNGAMGAQEISCETQGLTKPTNVQSCNTQACQTTVYEFYTGDFGSCSLSCNGGVQTRTVYCAVAGTNGGTGAQESSCLNQGLTKPSDIQSCNTQPCQTFTYEYFAGNWGVCTATCGVGTQSRDVFCIRIPENSIVDNSFCVNAVAPPSEQICPNLPTCETTLFEYFTGDYGTCSVSCGGGSQTRIVYCRAVGTTTEVGDALCTQQGLNKPSTSQSCGLGTCPNYQFITGSWNDCPVTCGSGTQTRTVNCINLTTNELVDNSVCLNLGMTLPENTQSCPDLPSCSSYEFVTGQWDACPVTCGSGTQTRTVNCINLTTNELFDNSVCLNLGMTLPENTQSCPDLPSCSSYEFVTDQWDACTVSCGGGGSQTRSVYCRIVGTTTQVEDSLCTQQGLNKPPTSQSCGLGTCPNYQFIPGTWNNCPVTCGSGTQTRTVNCINLTTNELVDNSVCLNLGMTLPENTQSCPDLPSCSSYEFVTDEWDACPVTCGSGIQTRTVSCYDTVSNGIVADSMCTNLGQTKPATQQACPGLNPCPTYVYQSGNWAGCSASCGGGTQTRTVTCIDSTSGTAVIESFCAGQTKPSTVGSCNTQACDGSTVLYRWSVSQWSECSTTCGDGQQTRETRCFSVNGKIEEVLESLCIAGDRPETVQSCNLGRCDGLWTAAPWSSCSVTCGIGTHSRYVYCALASSGDIVSTAECSEIPPATYELCDTEVDCGLYRWSVSQWSECSTTCGNGQQTRETRCFSVNGKIEEVLESLCIAGDRPETVQSCNLGRCDGLWTAAPWSSCSVSCDCGLQTRDVACRLTKEDDEILEEESCVASAKPTEERGCNTGPCPLTFDCGDTYTTETGVLSSPNYPANYPRDIECDKTVDYTLKTDGFHIEIDFLDFQLEGNTTDGDCLYDYVEVYDIEYNVSERYCGEFEELPMKKVYQGNSVRVRFVSDVSVENKGFLANWNYVSDDQPFYEASEWSECSVNCGTGEETRDITCMQGDDIVADSECNGLDRPESTRECTGAVPNCPPPTDVCGDVLDSSGLDVYSRGYPANYINGDNCITTIINSGGCVKITFNYLHVQESPECQHDYIEIQDLNFGTLTKRYCGNLDNNLVWQSGSGMVRVTFHSDNTVDGKGFTATADFCDAECGGGTKVRDVVCISTGNSQEVPDNECVGLRPMESEPCNEHQCPPSDCDTSISESGAYIQSFGYPDNNYLANQDCIARITNDVGCIRIAFLDFALEAGSTSDLCDNDYLEVIDGNNPMTQINTVEMKAYLLHGNRKVDQSL